MTFAKNLPAMFVLVAGLVGYSGATTYYVDSQNGSDSRAGTSDATSWQSLSKVNGTSFAAGDSIKFKCGGVWNGTLTLNKNGSSGSPIVYTNYGSGSLPKLTNYTSKANIVQVTGTFIVFDGFVCESTWVEYGTDFQDGWPGIGVNVTTSASNCIIRNVETMRVAAGMWLGGTNNLVTKCYWHDIHIGHTDRGATDTDGGGIGMTISGATDCEISYCRAVRCRCPMFKYGIDGGSFELWQAATRVKIHHNYSFESGGGLEQGGKGNPVTDITFAYNVLVKCVASNNTWLAIHNNPSDYWYSPVTGIKIYNNTFIDNPVAWSSGDMSSAITMRNNIFYNTGSGGVQSNNFNGDPGFVDLAGGDYHLKSSATGCIDRGADLGLAADPDLAIDFDGIRVPQGSAPDIGAYEFILDDPTPPSAPGNLAGQAVNAHTVNLSWSAATDAQTGIAKYIIYRDGQKVGESTTLTFTDSATVVASTAYQYQVSAVNRANGEGPKSSAVSVTTPGDTQPPTIAQAGVTSATQMVVTFSEPVEQSSAQIPGNYSIGGISVSSATLGTDLRTVSLTTSTMTQGSTYTLSVSNIRDRAASPNTIAPNSQVSITYYAGITRIRYYPRAAWAARMSGGVFEGTNGDPASDPYTALYTITSTPPDGQWTEATSLASMNGFRYVRYRASGNCNVAEIEFYRGAQKVSGTAFGTPGSWGNSGNDYTKAFDGDVNTFFDYTTDAGGYTGLDLQSGATVYGGRTAGIGKGIREIRMLSHSLIAVPAGRYTLRVVNAAGVTVLRESGMGPRTCDLSSVGTGLHFVTVTSSDATLSRAILNIR